MPVNKNFPGFIATYTFLDSFLTATFFHLSNPIRPCKQTLSDMLTQTAMPWFDASEALCGVYHHWSGEQMGELDPKGGLAFYRSR